ncbi:MAG TPA: type II toxin-antitoxin system VapC family toxin [Chloroflexota bacterium]|nr:type II toxin-antitoxin system VapC family toxin [Chloroflexota bacterium]
MSADGEEGNKPASDPPTLVIDASVAAKWLLRDEEGVDAAGALQDEHTTGRLALAAPRQIEVEVTAAIRRAVLTGRVDAAEGRRLVVQWLDELCPSLRLAANARALAGAFAFSLRYGVTLFDALYLTVAEQASSNLVVADERLLRSPAGALPFAWSLERWSAELKS